jgi:hypothetical protein
MRGVDIADGPDATTKPPRTDEAFSARAYFGIADCLLRHGIRTTDF